MPCERTLERRLTAKTRCTPSDCAAAVVEPLNSLVKISISTAQQSNRFVNANPLQHAPGKRHVGPWGRQIPQNPVSWCIEELETGQLGKRIWKDTCPMKHSNSSICLQALKRKLETAQCRTFAENLPDAERWSLSEQNIQTSGNNFDGWYKTFS